MHGLPQLMLVEDDQSIRWLLAEVLRCEGYEVVCAVEGQDALGQLSCMLRLPDLIILDLMMPGMDGWGFRKRQLAHPRFASIPILVVTAGERVCSRSLKVRADHVISKPLELDSLLDTILRAIPGRGPVADVG